jgi:hypothetical protein
VSRTVPTSTQITLRDLDYWYCFKIFRMAYLRDWQFVRPFCISTYFNDSQLSVFAQLANDLFAIIDIAGVRGVSGNISEIAILKLRVRIPSGSLQTRCSAVEGLASFARPPCSSTKSYLSRIIFSQCPDLSLQARKKIFGESKISIKS